ALEKKRKGITELSRLYFIIFPGSSFAKVTNVVREIEHKILLQHRVLPILYVQFIDTSADIVVFIEQIIYLQTDLSQILFHHFFSNTHIYKEYTIVVSISQPRIHAMGDISSVSDSFPDDPVCPDPAVLVVKCIIDL